MGRTKGSIKNEIHYLKQDRRDFKNYLVKWGKDEYYQKRLNYCIKRINQLENLLLNK